MDQHKAAVSQLATQVKSFYADKRPFHIYHGSTNSTRQSPYTRDNTVDTSPLCHVLDINTSKKVALVEPNVPMDALVRATLQHDLIPPVLMEFPGITAGGGFAGTSGESSSFRYGFFDRTVNWIEMVLADGEVVETSPDAENSDLFYGAASSFGTLGVTTLLELQLRDAKPFVQLTYFPVSGVAEAVEKIEQVTADPEYDYLDGILFAKDRGVVCAGILKDKPTESESEEGIHIQRFARRKDPWFYLHAEKVINNARSHSTKSPTINNINPTTELIPLVDYLFRYDRGGFWVAKYAFQYFLTPFNRITRWALDRLMHTRVLYHALHKSGLARQYIVQDVAVPYAAAEEFINYLDESFGHYPLWICPLNQTGSSRTKAYGLTAEIPSPSSPTEPNPEPNTKPNSPYLLNIGIWGPGPSPYSPTSFKASNRALEQTVHRLHGQKWLYAHTYYTEEEFWDIYDRPSYEALRAKYHAGYLPDLWTKVRVKDDVERKGWKERVKGALGEVWPVRGVYGVLSVLAGGREYLI